MQHEKMGVFKDQLPSHAPVATCYAPEVPAQPPSSAPVNEILVLTKRRTPAPEFVIHDVPPIEDPSQWIIRSPAVTISLVEPCNPEPCTAAVLTRAKPVLTLTRPRTGGTISSRAMPPIDQ